MGKREEALKEFISEAEEIIEGLNQSLLEMEATQDRTAIRPDVINAVFRGAHSLKGMSAMVGLKKVSEVSHRLEDILDKLRMGKLSLTDAVMEALLKGVEVIQGIIRLVHTGKGEETDVTPILRQINDATVSNTGPKVTSGLEATGFDPTILSVLTEYETHRLMENVKLGSHLLEITAKYKLETFDKDLSNLNAKLQTLGEIITTLPVSSMSTKTGIAFNLILGTKSDKEAVIHQLSGEDIELREIVPKSEGTSSGEGSTQPDREEGEGSIRSMTSTVRVDIGRLDTLLNIVGELVVTKAVISQIGKDLIQESGFTTHAVELQKASQNLDHRLAELQEGLIEVRMIPIGQVFDRLLRIIRKLSKELGKEVDLQIAGEETKLDKSMIEAIADPLMHLVRNALDHGIESKEERRKSGKPDIGIINLRAMQKGNNVVIEVEDDGAGIDLAKVYQKGLKKRLLDKDKEYERQELLDLLFRPGFSTTETVTEVSGRGVGLDVVAKNITNLNGMVDIQTEEGQGTQFSITLPITLVIIRALIVKAGLETFAIPLNSISESLMIESEDILTIGRKEVIRLRDHTLSLLRLRDVFYLQGGASVEPRVYVIVVGLAEKRLGLVVDAIEGQQEIVIKALGEILRNTPGIAGATELGNRKTILVLDVGALIEEAIQTHTPAGR